MPVLKPHIFCFLFLILGFNFTQAQFGKALFQDNFENSDKGWPIENSESITTHIEHGRYVLDKKTTKGAQLIWNTDIEINSYDDYVVETHMKHLTGNADYGYGITWGGADGRNYFAFTVSATGSFAIYKFEEGVFFDIKENTFLEDQVRTSGSWNHLKVLKSGKTISFYVNDQLVFTMPFEAEMGPKTGLVLNMDMKVLVDDYSVSLPAGTENANSTIELVWLNPKHIMTTTDKNQLHVEVGVRSSELLHHVSLYLNHVLVSKNEGFELVRGETDLDEIITENVIFRSGVNEIKVVVEDVRGHQLEETHVVKLVDDTNEERRDLALLFVTDEYEHWMDLINPINDGQILAAELEKYYGFKVEVVKNANISEVMIKLKEYAKATYNEQDQLLIFFAGHGKYDEDFGDGYVVCSNSLREDAGNTTHISHSNLQTVVNNIPCEHVFLMMDVCFGGTFDKKLANRSSHRGDGDVYDELSRKQYIDHKLQYDTRLYLTSGGKEYVPDGRPGYHSPFIRKILEALRSHGGEDKILTFSEILHYLERVQPEPRWGEFGDNEPGSDFMFIIK